MPSNPSKMTELEQFQAHIDGDLQEAIDMVRGSLGAIEARLKDPDGQPEIERDKLEARVGRLLKHLWLQHYVREEFGQVEPDQKFKNPRGKAWHY